MPQIFTEKSEKIIIISEKLKQVYSSINPEKLSFVPEIEVENLIKTLENPKINSDIGGVDNYDNSWLGYINYMASCIDSIARELNPNITETFDNGFINYANPNFTGERYKLKILGAWISCDIDFRGNFQVPEEMEEEKDVQCLRIAYDFLYKPCEDIFGDIKSIRMSDYNIPINSLSVLVNPVAKLEERVEEYRRCREPMNI
ncbi:MAG: hypothetical protein Q7S33_00495 [Nanoarchaeota archaeon]|nr:hypothetical protein [Nanoarchaeota archaeon]